MAKEKHGMTGVANARKKESNMTAAIHVRCTPEEKAHWIKWLRENNKGKISDYIRSLMPEVD